MNEIAEIVILFSPPHSSPVLDCADGVESVLNEQAVRLEHNTAIISLTHFIFFTIHPPSHSTLSSYHEVFDKTECPLKKYLSRISVFLLTLRILCKICMSFSIFYKRLMLIVEVKAVDISGIDENTEFIFCASQ